MSSSMVERLCLAAAGLGLLASQAMAAGAGILPGSASKDPYTVDANKLDYLEKDGKLVYTGDVIATQGPTRIKGSVMTIYLDRSGGESDRQVRRIEMRGPVTLTQSGKVGVGDTGLYDKAENKWYLLGNVTLTEGTDVTQGDKLIYDLGSSTALVDSGKQGRVKSVFTPKDSTADSKSGGTKSADTRFADTKSPDGKAPDSKSTDAKPGDSRSSRKSAAKRPETASNRP